MVQPVSIETVRSAGPEHEWERYYKLKPGDVFVEAGAFWGRYGIIASLKGCSKIILIEASPANIATIENVVAVDGLKNVILVKKAITSEKKKVGFVTWGNPAGNRLSHGPDDFPGDTVEVEGDTLDNILTDLGVDCVDLLASDCEGAEIDLVKGAEKYLKEARIRHVAIGTYHAQGNHEAVASMLGERGFKGLKYEDGVTYGHL